MNNFKAVSIFNFEKKFQDKPLAIYGAGPSFDLLPRPPFEPYVFALNHTYTKLAAHKKAFWFSNDHDRTWKNKHIHKAVLSRIDFNSPWKTITLKKFIPGEFGDFEWYDRKGTHPPMKWRLPLPEGSTVYYYNSGPFNKHFDDYIEAGETVLELALEVATLWGFSPIVLIGCDLHLDNEKNYYSKQFRWKQTPARMLRGKIEKARKSVIARREHWAENIYMLSDLWQATSPFINVSKERALALLRGT